MNEEQGNTSKKRCEGTDYERLKKTFFLKKNGQNWYTLRVEMFKEMQGNHFHENHKSGYFYKGKKGCDWNSECGELLEWLAKKVLLLDLWFTIW